MQRQDLYQVSKMHDSRTEAICVVYIIVSHTMNSIQFSSQPKHRQNLYFSEFHTAVSSWITEFVLAHNSNTERISSFVLTSEFHTAVSSWTT